MTTQLHADHLSAFKVRTWPPPGELGQALEGNLRIPGARLQLRFGDQVASVGITDVWSTCCELLLQAQLVREAKLDRFVVDVEHIFELGYDSDIVFCTFSREHVFAVDRQQFAACLEQVVDDVFEGTSCPRLMRIAAGWAASNIRAQPYSYRFSNSVLT
jgi:hypothetical protein